MCCGETLITSGYSQNSDLREQRLESSATSVQRKLFRTESLRVVRIAGAGRSRLKFSNGKACLLYPHRSAQDRHDVDPVVPERKPRSVAKARLFRAGQREYPRWTSPARQAALRASGAAASAGYGGRGLLARSRIRNAKQSLFLQKLWMDFLIKRDCARQFFSRMEELNLESKLVFFPRNQSQLVNSRYTEVVRALHRSESFETFVQAEIRHPSFRYSHLIALADAFSSKLIAKPFTEETMTRGVVPEFLRAIEIDPLHVPGYECPAQPGSRALLD